MNQRNLALLAATTTSIIYGVNHTIAKDLMPHVIEPYGFIFLRISGVSDPTTIFPPPQEVMNKEINNMTLSLIFTLKF